MQNRALNLSEIKEIQNLIQKTIAGDVRIDQITRLLYSTDASIYQIEPLGVIFPRTLDDLSAVMEVCAQNYVPVLARGAGSSLAGQSIGKAFILDCSRYLDRLVAIDPERHSATIEPGVIMSELNKYASRYGLQFGPDPASAERATMGGSLANNATGAHSLLYGMAADHLLSAEVVLSDGAVATFGPTSTEEAINKGRIAHPASAPDVEREIYRAALEIRQHYADTIRSNWPLTWRRASGYNLNYLLPWSPSKPPLWEYGNQHLSEGNSSTHQTFGYPPVDKDHINIAQLIAGSEGTLGIIRRATVQLVNIPEHRILSVLAFPSIAEACETVPEILSYKPSAVELIPRTIIRLARSVPAYARQMHFLDSLLEGEGKPAAILVVEFSGSRKSLLKETASSLGGFAPHIIAYDPAAQKQVWDVRKVGLGILMSQPGDYKPWSFIEDLSVPVERLGEFVREMEYLLVAYGTHGEMYAHASVGCLHIRPILNLKTGEGVRDLREISRRAVELTLGLGGAVSGEHGDGLARTEWLDRMFGEEVINAFRQLKQAADPNNILNPGKIVSPIGEPVPLMDQNLRFGPDFKTTAWLPVMNFKNQGSLVEAIEQCNGAGVCRKLDGVMCPSFQATRDEMHSTRGRANLLRAMIAGDFPAERDAGVAVHQALDLCLACKGCKAECPSKVDMAKLKYEFTHWYHSREGGRHPRRFRDYLFGYIDLFAYLGHHVAPIANKFLRNPSFLQWAEKTLGLASQRKLPLLSRNSFTKQFSKDIKKRQQPKKEAEQVFLLSDAFTEYFYPEIGLSTVNVLRSAGCQVVLLPVVGAGRMLLSRGFLTAAKRHAIKLIRAVNSLDPKGVIPIVGIEPSEIYTILEEYPDLCPGDEHAKLLAERCFTIEEYLSRPPREGEFEEKQPRIIRIVEQLQANHATLDLKSSMLRHRNVLIHGHCYQKSRQPAEDGYPVGVGACCNILQLAGYHVEEIDSGCCGVAGAFGYEAEHFDLSLQIGEFSLLPKVREAGQGTIIAASGYSCRAQIDVEEGLKALHPVEILAGCA